MAAKYLEFCNLDPSCLVVEGDKPNTSFICRFAGQPNVAADRAFRFLRAMRRGDGTRDIVQGADVEGEFFQAYWEPDKNQKMQRTEFLSKRLSTIIASTLPQGARVTANRPKGIVSVGMDEIAMVEVVSREEVVLRWSEDMPSSLAAKIDKEQVAKEFEGLSKPRNPTRWS